MTIRGDIQKVMMFSFFGSTCHLEIVNILNPLTIISHLEMFQNGIAFANFIKTFFKNPEC